MRRIIVSLVSLLLPLATVSAQHPAVTPYQAVYEIRYKGKDSGEATFSVAAAQAPGQFRFRSESNLRGLVARLVAPRPIIDESEFTLLGDRPQPARFRYADGSRKGDDNFAIDFTWPSTAVLTLDGGSREIELAPGVLDRGSAQVALMQHAASGTLPGEYLILDDDGIETYVLTELDRQTTTTRAGTYETLRIAQQRTGSSRRTVYWMAPELEFLPVRIEQIRDGEVQTEFVLESVNFAGP